MKFDNPLYDRIRVKPDEDRRLRAACPTCDWAGCDGAATHKAPKGRGHERKYWNFCLDHVREYNQSYNYFAGMADDDVAAYQKESLTGHRPTWKIGVRAPRETLRPDLGFDPLGMFGDPVDGAAARKAREETRAVRNAERKALETLGIDQNATKAQVKARFKELVKRHHPDLNGGDRSGEERLRDIIQAHNVLKGAGRA